MKDARTLSAAFLFPAAVVLAGPAAAAPLIENASANASLTSVTVNGSDLLGKKARSLFLSGFATPLATTTWTDTQIVASLPPGLAPGSYSLIIQGQGGNDFDEFFATFVVAAGGGGGTCTSYSNSMSSGAFGASLSVNTPGNYALSAKLVVNAFGASLATLHCTLAQLAPAAVVDDTFATGTGEVLVMLQGTATTTAPAQFQVTCTTTAPIALSYYNSKIQAVCLPALVSPSP
jgi:hypothetical protein